MRPNWEKVAVLPKAVFVLNKDDTISKIVQYEYAPCDHKTKKSTGMRITAHYRFQIHVPWTFIKNSSISKEAVSEYLLEINYSRFCSGQERPACGKVIKSTAQLDQESKSAQHVGH